MTTTTSKRAVPIAVRLEAETKLALDELARNDECTTADYIRRALREHVDRERGRRTAPRGEV
jgi:predicted transcriptional regulator